MLTPKTENPTFALPASSFFCLSSSSITAVPVAETRGKLLHAKYQRGKPKKLTAKCLSSGLQLAAALLHSHLLARCCLLVGSPPPCFPRKHETQLWWRLVGAFTATPPGIPLVLRSCAVGNVAIPPCPNVHHPILQVWSVVDSSRGTMQTICLSKSTTL